MVVVVAGVRMPLAAGAVAMVATGVARVALLATGVAGWVDLFFPGLITIVADHCRFSSWNSSFLRTACS